MEFPCDVCSVVASSEEQLALHKDGKRHKKHLLMAQVLAEPPAAVTAAADSGEAEALRCELCDVTAPSAVHKQLHLRWSAYLKWSCLNVADPIL